MQSGTAQVEVCQVERKAAAWQGELALAVARQESLEEDNERLGRLLARAEQKAGLFEAQRDGLAEEKAGLEEQLRQMKYSVGAALGEAKQRDRYYRLAVEREGLLKKEVARLKNDLYQQKHEARKREESLQRRIAHLEWELRQKDEELAKVQAKLRCREQQLFGRKTEKSEQGSKAGSGEHAEACTRRRRRRGKKRGQKGHGRQIPKSLPEVEVAVAVPERQCRCPDCGLPYEDLNSTEDSVEIHWEIRLVKRVYKRQKCRRTCGGYMVYAGYRF